MTIIVLVANTAEGIYRCSSADIPTNAEALDPIAFYKALSKVPEGKTLTTAMVEGDEVLLKIIQEYGVMEIREATQ